MNLHWRSNFENTSHIDGLHLTSRRPCWRYNTKNTLLVTSLDPAGVGGCHCLLHAERLIAKQEYDEKIKVEVYANQEKFVSGIQGDPKKRSYFLYKFFVILNGIYIINMLMVPLFWDPLYNTDSLRS